MEQVDMEKEEMRGIIRDMLKDMAKDMVSDMVKDAMDRMSKDMMDRYDGMLKDMVADMVKDAMSKDMSAKDMEEEEEEKMEMVSMDSMNQIVASRVGLISKVKPFLKDSAGIETLEPRAIYNRFLTEQGFEIKDSHSDEYLAGRVDGLVETLQAKADRPSSTGSLRDALSQATHKDQADLTPERWDRNSGVYSPRFGVRTI